MFTKPDEGVFKAKYVIKEIKKVLFLAIKLINSFIYNTFKGPDMELTKVKEFNFFN